MTDHSGIVTEDSGRSQKSVTFNQNRRSRSVGTTGHVQTESAVNTARNTHPPTDALEALIARVLSRSDSFQGRVASRGHIQVPLDFPQHAKWVALFRRWWRAGFESWQQRHAGDGQSLIFLCELGPPDYAITEKDGREQSDRWGEALTLAKWAREIWAEVRRAP